MLSELAIFAGALVAAATPGTSSPAAVALGAPVAGALAPGDERTAAGALADSFLFDSAVAQTVTVLVLSLDADTRLTLFDDGGRELGSDNQGGVGDNPRLVLHCESGRTYRIRVEGAAPAEAGSYEVEIRAGDAASPVNKAKVEADLSYYAHALQKARARGPDGRGRAGWALVRSNEIKELMGLAAAGDRLAVAEEALELARQVTDRKLEATALNQCGLAHSELNRQEAAVGLLQRARALHQQERDLAGEITSTNRLARAHMYRSEYPRAEALFTEALALSEKSGDPRRAILLTNLGALYEHMEDLPRAVAYAQRGLEAARELKDGRAEAITLGNIALMQARLNDFGRSLEHAERSLEVARRVGYRRGEATALANLANLYGMVGRPETAIRHSEESLAILRELGEPRRVSLALTTLGGCYSNLGRHARAIEHFQEARGLYRELGASDYEAITLALLAEAYMQLGEWDRARHWYEETLRIATEVGRRIRQAQALEGLAAVQLQQGDGVNAMKLAEQALEVLRRFELGEPAFESQARTTLARAADALGLKSRAREEFERALAVIEGARTRAGSDPNRATFLDRGRRLFESYVAFLHDQHEPEGALAVAERARARSLLDVLGRRDGGSSAAADESTSRRLASATPPSLEQIKEEARRRQGTFLEYFVSDERLFIWVVTPERQVHAAVSPVKRAELTDLVRQMRSALKIDVAARDWEAADDDESPLATRGPVPPAGGPASSPENARRTLRRLHDLLVSPVAKWLPRRPDGLVTIVPHGPLFLVSFAALTDARGRYLVERHTLSYAPSIGALAYLEGHRPPGPAAGDAGVLVVGNPAMPSLPGRKRKPAPLPGAEAETRAISRLYPAARVTTLIGGQADERRVRALAPAHGIIHLATHGFIRDDEPEESLLALSPSPSGGAEPGPDADGLLTVREVAQMDLHAHLVVLSACNTGLGRLSGDGVIGLTRAFLQAGSPRVLASLWRVADVVATPHMEHFHRALRQNGSRSAVALRTAQLATIRDLRAKRYRTASGAAIPDLPTFWASFVLIGDPN